MKMKTVYTLLMLGGCGAFAAAQSNGQEADFLIKEKSVDQVNGMLSLRMKVDVSKMEIPGDESVICTPLIEAGDSTRVMAPLILNGRSRHILYQRLDRPQNEQEYRRMNGETQVLNYQGETPYADWMEKANVSLIMDNCGCGWEALQQNKSPLFALDFSKPVELTPEMVYWVPQAEAVKARKLEGSAYLDFPVNQTTINPSYRRNPEELRKIRETIDAVRNDPYTTITRVAIKGYASPEGAYKSNAYLAENRAKALSNYVKGLYDFGSTQMTVDYEPEDWKGLEKAVENGNLSDKQELLSIIRADEPADYDQREQKLKAVNGGASYRTLLADVYPSLRHSDYEVDYTIRNFSIDEAKKLAFSDPSKLSLNEFFQVAESYPAGSDEFNEVFETAVRMYPDDPVSNLNAAITAIQSKQLSKAKRYLAKANDCPQKELAKAAIAMYEGRTDEARQLLKGIEQASEVADAVKENLRQLENL